MSAQTGQSLQDSAMLHSQKWTRNRANSATFAGAFAVFKNYRRWPADSGRDIFSRSALRFTCVEHVYGEKVSFTNKTSLRKLFRAVAISPIQVVLRIKSAKSSSRTANLEKRRSKIERFLSATHQKNTQVLPVYHAEVEFLKLLVFKMHQRMKYTLFGLF